MQRGAGVTARAAAPGIFETIATAMSALMVQPLPLVLPIVIDLYLWAGARLSPAAVAEPLRRWLLTAGNADRSQLTGAIDALDRLSRTGDLAAIVGWFLPSLLVDGGRPTGATSWSRASVHPGSPWLTIGLTLALLLVGVWGAMAFGVVLARLIRGRSLIGDRFVVASIQATLRYLGFLAMIVLAVGAILVPTAVVGGVLLFFGVAAAPLLVAVLIVPVLAAYVCLAFVGDAIVVAEVGPVRACMLSYGVVRRNPWAAVGLLLVVIIATGAVAQLAIRVAGDVPGLMLAIAGYAFVATGLALARMQFFYERLRRWRADLVPSPQPAK